MKKYFFILLPIIFFNCSDSITTPLPGDSVSLTYIESSEFTSTLLLVNNTDESIFYLGYSKCSPLKRVEMLTDTGWVTVVLDWCATGAEQIELTTKENTTIQVPAVAKNRKARVILYYSTKTKTEEIELKSNEYIIP